MKGKTIKVLEEDTGEQSCDLGVSKYVSKTGYKKANYTRKNS